jgi:hypothetical protein
MFVTAVSIGIRYGRTTFSKARYVPSGVARVNPSLFHFQHFTTSATKDLVTTKLEPDTGVAEISMHNGAVNSLSLEMCVGTTFEG